MKADPVSTRRLPRWAAWPIGVGLVVAAWFVALATPGEEQAQAPFRVTATLGEQAVGRNIAVTVTDVRRASGVDAGGWSTEGNWLVIDVDAQSVLSEAGASLGHAMVEIDGVRFSASDRPLSLVDHPLATGIPVTGSLAFELPDELTSGAGTLELAVDGTDTRLDSMIVLPFDLAEVAVVGETALLENGWTNP